MTSVAPQVGPVQAHRNVTHRSSDGFSLTVTTDDTTLSEVTAVHRSVLVAIEDRSSLELAVPIEPTAVLQLAHGFVAQVGSVLLVGIEG